ncbi:protocadherin gamma-B1 [Columba livia]|uniref:Protocadherin gamma-B1 n=1 Tax=Columba livia TaxID=8932 RepID=A0A2I0LQM7_COLLI|nr:protocadherin gamma-B1 [Columba livia]
MAGWQRQAARRVLLPALLLSFCWRAAAERLRYTIPEELGRGSLVGPLARDLGLSPADLSARKLRLASAAKRQLQYFTVSGENGNLYVSERLDREEMCGEAASCSVSFEALVQNPLNVFDVEVVIQDVNDNSPTFSKAALDLEIGEWIPPGARFPLEMARDADVGSNSLLTYQLTGNPAFTLSIKESSDGSKQPELVLEKALDREKQSSFQLVLTAVDGGDPVRSGTVQIRINVTDANDNAPVFSKSVYVARVRENVPAGSLVLRVRATDVDAGSNGWVSYSFGNVPDSVRALFSVDSESGEVKTVGSLDFEEKSKYSFGLEARDGGGLTGHCKVQINVTDANDNAPEITMLSVSSPVSEDAPAGTVVALLKVRDRDSGENGEVSCELSDEAPLSLVKSSGGSYKVVTASALDREQAAEHRVTVVARDQGRPSLSSSTALVLEVSDVNDNAPVFDQAEYTVRVPEDVPVGSTLVTVTATDADEGPNGHLKYSLKKATDMALDIFRLDAETGAITLVRSLDYEKDDSYEMEVQTHDGGGLFDKTKVTITVTDVNDNPPEITVSSAVSEISEDAPPGTMVALLYVQDRDSGANGEVRCSLEGAVPFRLQSSRGSYYSVVIARELDREQVSEYNLTVQAADGGSPALWSSAVLRLRVLDVNDNAPVFAEARYSARVPENNAAGALVLRVRAWDADWGQNARVRYWLGEGRVRGAPLSSSVSVEAETGALYALRSFDYEEVREVGLWVRAEDGGAPALSSNVSVRLVIVDQKDNAPQVL